MRQDDALLPSAAGFRRLAIDILDQANNRAMRMTPEQALDHFLNPPFNPDATVDWVERTLREALRGA